MTAIVITAPSSGAGKTSVTLGLLRALRSKGLQPRSLKLGPDYIDTGLHAAATGRTTFNLDGWSMSPDMQSALLAGSGPLVIEAAMGMFDGAGLTGTGSAAEIAVTHNLPVAFVIDCTRMSHTIAAIVQGLRDHNPLLRMHGVILNNVGSPRHEGMLRAALDRAGIRVLAALSRNKSLAHPSRHLGLVQADERTDQDAWLETLGQWISDACDPETLLADWDSPVQTPLAIAPPAQSIAIAKDIAFSFAYPHLLKSWKDAGAELRFFSPLADEAAPEADLVYLPGGYPELHAGQIANARRFLKSLRKAAQGVDIYGECGGYMTLGDGLIDADGTRHEMAGLLRLETSFEKRSLHLGYRNLTSKHGPFSGSWRGHEFHHSTTLAARGNPLFYASDADGTTLPDMGLHSGRVFGSYAHLIAPVP